MVQLKIGVIGTGYVGLVTGTCLAEIGHRVVCNDVNEDKIAGLERGQLPIYEPGLEPLVIDNADAGRLSFTTDIERTVAGADVVFIAVGTPPDEDGSADRRYVLEAAEGIGRVMTGPLVVAVKSTVPVGTCDRVRARIAAALRARGAEIEFDVVSNPEFLKEGKAVEDFMYPDRVVVGTATARARDVMGRVYAPLLGADADNLIFMTVRSSEMTKYAANVMLATRISLMNEFARICEGVGADVVDVSRGIGSDQRIGPKFLRAGIGYGGSCFPKDVQALARLAIEAGSSAEILEAVERVNRNQKMLLANRIIARFGNDLSGKRIAVWGLAFKPDTDDIREAPARTIIKRLLECGATVVAYDPIARENFERAFADQPNLHFTDDMYAACEGADALALVTEWRDFAGSDLERLGGLLREPVLFDGRNVFEPTKARGLGLEYHCIGRAA